jgi:predicted DNA-binding WGR domain protein
MKRLDAGDVVIVPAVDRLSRGAATDLLLIARGVEKAGAGLRSVAEPVADTTGDFAEIVLAILGVSAKLERRRLKERTARGDAKANGAMLGRKPFLTLHRQQEARKRIEVGGDPSQRQATDPSRYLHRYYRLHVQPDIFGVWCFICGRIGQARQVRSCPFPTPDTAEAQLQRQLRVKERRGHKFV